MPLKKGHAPEVVSYNIKEMMKAGHPQKQAIAAALASARKYKKMSEGGMVSNDMDDDVLSDNDENAMRTLGEIQAMGEYRPGEVANPHEQDEERELAMNLYKKSEEAEMGYAMGGLVEPEMDSPVGNKPTEDMSGPTEEPMAVEKKAMLSKEAMDALEMHKKKRRFMR